MYREISFDRARTPEIGSRRRPARTEAADHPVLRWGLQVLAAAGRFLAAYKERLRIRRDEELLRQMSAHQLRDIGLERLPGGHFAPISRDPWLEQPVQILGRGNSGRRDPAQGRRPAGTRR